MNPADFGLPMPNSLRLVYRFPSFTCLVVEDIVCSDSQSPVVECLLNFSQGSQPISRFAMASHREVENQVARMNWHRKAHVFYFYRRNPPPGAQQFLEILKTKFRVTGDVKTFNPEGQDTVEVARLAIPDAENLVLCFDHTGHLDETDILKWA